MELPDKLSDEDMRIWRKELKLAGVHTLHNEDYMVLFREDHIACEQYGYLRKGSTWIHTPYISKDWGPLPGRNCPVEEQCDEMRGM